MIPPPRDYRRGAWREQSHRDSHSAGGQESAGPIAPHPLASASPAVSVSTDDAMAAMVDHLKSAGTFAFDSEFIGEMSYEPQLCLVQTATTQRVFIVDPLSGLDMTPLWELIADAAVEKIVLAGQQDFPPAVQRTGRAPANIMDVQIAAGFISVEYPLSLVRLLEQFVGVSVGKAHTASHWGNRPLSDVQMRYAADDVRYLPAAREAIAVELAKLDRAAWAREECAAIEDIALYLPSPAMLYMRVRGRDRLSRRQLGILRELAILRDQAARQENLPPRTLMNDGVLLALTRHWARSVADLDNIKGLPRPVESQYGRQIVEATARAMAMPPEQLPPAGVSDDSPLQDRVDEIWTAMGQFCIEHSIALALVASRKEVARTFRAAKTGQPLEQYRLLRGWRKELLGDFLKKWM